jgi:integrase
MLDVGAIRRDKGAGSKPRWRAAEGRWEARWTRPDGRRKSEYSRIPGPAGEKAAAKLRDAAIEAAHAGVDPSLMPLADYLDAYLARRASLSDDSRQRYARLVKRIRTSGARNAAGKVIAEIPLIRVKTDDIEDLYAHESASGMAPKGVELLHTLIHGALAKAQTRGKVLRNAADGAERAKVTRIAPDGPGRRRSCAELMDASRGTRLEAFVAVLATTGQRHGELRTLTWADVVEDRIVLRDPEKGGVPRTILLAPRVVRALKASGRRSPRRASPVAAPGTTTTSCSRRRGATVLDPTQVRMELAAIAKAAGLPAITPADAAPRGRDRAARQRRPDEGRPGAARAPDVPADGRHLRARFGDDAAARRRRHHRRETTADRRRRGLRSEHGLIVQRA